MACQILLTSVYVQMEGSALCFEILIISRLETSKLYLYLLPFENLDIASFKCHISESITTRGLTLFQVIEDDK